MLNLVVLALIIVCIFDPAGKILEIKYFLFVVSWILMIIRMIVFKKNRWLNYEFFIYICLFLFIPILSIMQYFVFDAKSPYDGFLFFKSYLFITLTLVLTSSGIDFLGKFCAVLTSLSILTILIFFIIMIFPFTLPFIDAYGIVHGNLSLGQRTYGTYSYYAIFYRTSPMIVFAICYYVYWFYNTSITKKFHLFILSFINIFALFLSGTRANIIVSLLVPLVLILRYSKHKRVIVFVVIFGVLALASRYAETVFAMLNPKDVSNSQKIGYLTDYKTIFDSVPTILFGQGIGAYNTWTSMGFTTSQTELTYIEIFRNYGIVLGVPLLVLLIYPLIRANYRHKEYIKNGYLCYLLVSFTNPFIFSSSGMLILSIVLSSLIHQGKNSIHYSITQQSI